MLKATLIFIAASAFCSAAVCEVRNVSIPIVRSAPGDKGAYRLLQHERHGHMVKTLHSRTGPLGVDYTKSEFNCSERTYRTLGTSDESIKAIKHRPSKWTDLVAGSSASDTLIMVCAM